MELVTQVKGAGTRGLLAMKGLFTIFFSLSRDALMAPLAARLQNKRFLVGV